MDFSPTIDKLQGMLDGALAILPSLVAGSIVFFLVYLLSKALRQSVRSVVERSGAGSYASFVIGRMVQWATLAIGSMVVVTIRFPSVDAQTLISILGISSLAIGFAFRDIAQSFLAGVLILLTRPFKIDDQIEINGYEGTVENILTRATYVRTYDGRIVVVPNADFLTETVIVNTSYDIRRSEYDVGIGYADDIPPAKSLILSEVRDVDGVLLDPAPDILTTELSDSSVNLKVRWWTPSTRSDVVSTTDTVVTAIKRALNRGGIDIPFPIRTIYLNSNVDTTTQVVDE